MRTITSVNELCIGDRVRFLADGMLGTVDDFIHGSDAMRRLDYSCIKILWDDGTTSLHSLSDGFTAFVPVQI